MESAVIPVDRSTVWSNPAEQEHFKVIRCIEEHCHSCYSHVGDVNLQNLVFKPGGDLISENSL